jgi:hypothetical protein
VEPLVRRVRAAAGVGRQQNLRPLELADGMLAAAQHRRQFVPLGLAQFDPATYISSFTSLSEAPDESIDESKIRRTLYREAGPLPGLHYTYSHMFGRPPAETDPQRHFRVSPPSVHQLIVTLESNGLIRRQPGIPEASNSPCVQKTCRS